MQDRGQFGEMPNLEMLSQRSKSLRREDDLSQITREPTQEVSMWGSNRSRHHPEVLLSVSVSTLPYSRRSTHRTTIGPGQSQVLLRSQGWNSSPQGAGEGGWKTGTQIVRLWASLNLVLKYLLYQPPRWLSDEEPACQRRRRRWHGFDPWVEKILRRRKWQPTPVFLPNNLRDGGACLATVHRIVKNWTQLSMHAWMHINLHM